MKVAQELKEADIPRQVGFAETPKYPQIGLQQRKEALRSMLMHVPTRVLLLRVIYCVMRIARDQSVAAGRVRVELAAGLYGEGGRFLHRLDGKVPRRVDHDPSLAADPGDDGGPVLVVMAAPGLAFLAAPPWRGGPGPFFPPPRFCPCGRRYDTGRRLRPSPPIAAPSHRTGPHCAATNTSDSPSAYVLPTLGQCVERNTTGTTETSRESSA